MARAHRRIGPPDGGSVTPLVIGMVLCLLLLSAGVTAATSAFLAHQRLQNACDGAAAAAANAVDVGYYTGSGAGTRLPLGSAEEAAALYLQTRSPAVRAAADTSAGAVRLTCTASAAITFGALFGKATMSQSVTSVGRPVL